MYDFSEDEENSLPLPPNWARTIDTTGSIVYKHLSSGNLAEEHPLILQGLDLARKLPLPNGWIVKEVTNDGIRDYFYCNPLFDLSGWDPPQFRSCLAECLMKNGFSDAAMAVLEHPNNQLLKHPGIIPPINLPQQTSVQQPEPMPSAPSPVEDSLADPPSDKTTTTRNVDWMELMEHLGTLEEPSSRAKYPTAPLPVNSSPYSQSHYLPEEGEEEEEKYLTGDEQERYEKYTEKTDNESMYSLTSRRSRRSDRWLDLLNQKSQSKKRLTASDLRSQQSLQKPSEITTKSLNRLVAFQIDANEKCHELLIQLRSQLCKRSGLTCNLLAYHNLDSDVGSLDTNTLCDHPYRIDQINSMITLAEGLISFLRNHIELLVMALASIPSNSPELLITSYAILHRIFHPFSSEASMTTSFLLESLNYQIEMTCAQLDDHNPQTLYGRNTMSRECSGQEILLVTLLTNTLVEEVSTQYQPLHRPVFSYYPRGGEPQWPEYSLTLFGVLLRSYGIRRDVTSFFRLIWRQVLPALCAVIDSTELSLSSSKPSGLPPPHSPAAPFGHSTHPLETLTFGKLIPIATRILECTFLEESLTIYPATVTAMIRCLGEICGSHGIHLYLLEFLILPNLTKLLLGDVESIDNEQPLRSPSLWTHSEKYFDHRNWWPRSGDSFIESSNHQLLTILDGSGMLIWCVWRLYICAIFYNEEILINFSVSSFLSPLQTQTIRSPDHPHGSSGGSCLNPAFSGLSDAKLRTVLLRIRTKISKGCDSLLQMPLDSQGISFLESRHTSQPHTQQPPQTWHTQQPHRRYEEEIKKLKFQTRNFSILLRNRLKSLYLLKPPEALNATILSRYETMILFDSLAFVAEEQLEEYERIALATAQELELDEVELELYLQQQLGDNNSYREVQWIHEQTCRFLSLSEELETQGTQVDLNHCSEDIMFLWRTPDPRHWRLYPSSSLPLSHPPPHGGGDDISVFTQDTNFSFSLPPPPLPPPPLSFEEPLPPPPPMTEEDLLYAYEQLQRGHTLSLRYISALNRMLHHLRLHRSSHPNTSSAAASASAVVCLPPLRSLLDSEEWFYCPEVDISCPLAAENHLYHHSTESHLLKLKPNQFGLELSALQQQHTGRGRGRGGGREEFVPLQSQLNEFFDSFRFQNSSRSAGANTSVDLSNKLPPKLIHPHAASASAAVASLFPNGLAGDQRSVSRSRTSYRTKKPPTRSTLPEDSPLLVPTESYAQQKVSKRTLADIDKEFVTSLRTAPPLAAGSGSQSSSPLRRIQQRQQHQRQESSISNAQPFPEHLRRHLRGATAEGGAGSYHRRTPSPIASAQGARSDSSLNLLRRRNSGNGNSLSKERKMPLPVEFSASGGASVSGNLIFAPTESRLRQLNQDKHRLEEELTVEQEKGWKNLLRSYDQMSDGSSLRAKPFRPSSGGSVGFAGASSEHSSRPRSRSSRRQGRSLLTPPAADESRGSLADMFLSEVRGIDMKSFLMKLDHATASSPSAAASSPVERQANRSKSQSDDQEEEEREEEEERQSLSRSRSDSDDLSESLPLHSLSLFQSLLKRNALSTSAPASAVAPGVDIETPRRSVPNPSAPLRQPEAEATAAPEMASQRISQHGIPLSLPLRGATLSPISSSSSPVSSRSSAEKDSSSSILFPALSLHGDRDKAGDRIGNGDGDDLFEFSLEEQEQDRDLRGLDRGSGLGLGLSKVLSAAALAGGVTGDRNQHSIGERPLNLQRRLRQRESQSNKETTTTVSVPITVPSAESPPAAGGEAEAAAQSSSQRLNPNGAPIPALSPLSRQSSSYSFNSVEGKRPLVERRTSSPSPDPALLEQLQQEQEQQQELPVTRVNRSSLDSQDREEEEEEKDEVPSPSALPSAADSPLSDDQPQPQSSPSVSPSGKRIPILRKQLSLTPNDLRTLLVRGFEVVKHGVSGYPKPKVVAYDPSSQEIIWRSSKKDRFSFMRSSSSLLEKTLPLRDITEVRKGIQTDVLMKGGLLDPGRCVSLVTAYRTLDLVFGSQRDRELFVRSLIVLLDEQKQQQEVSGGSGTVPDVIFR